MYIQGDSRKTTKANIIFKICERKVLWCGTYRLLFDGIELKITASRRQNYNRERCHLCTKNSHNALRKL